MHTAHLTKLCVLLDVTLFYVVLVSCRIFYFHSVFLYLFNLLLIYCKILHVSRRIFSIFCWPVQVFLYSSVTIDTCMLKESLIYLITTFSSIEHTILPVRFLKSLSIIISLFPPMRRPLGFHQVCKTFLA